MRTSFLFLLFLALSACASKGLRPTSSFNSESSDGLVVVGVDGKAKASFTLAFGKLDTETKRLKTFKSKALSYYGGDDGGKHFMAVKLSPGTHVFKSISSQSYSYPTTTNHVTCLSAGTYMFNVQPGQILYVGDIQVNYGVRFIGFDTAGAEAFLKTMPKVKGQMHKYEPQITEFENGKDLFGTQTVCGGYYMYNDKQEGAE